MATACVKNRHHLPVRLMFQDEARFGRISDTRRCWCPKPTRPVCYAMVTQEYTYAYAAVSADGVLDTLILPSTNSDCMQIFLDEVASRHLDENVLMILDGAGWHTSGLLAIPPNMRLLSLPPYSPELNPDEYLNGDLKTRVHSGIHAGTESDLKQKTQSFMRMLVKRPHRVRSYFHHPMVAYAR